MAVRRFLLLGCALLALLTLALLPTGAHGSMFAEEDEDDEPPST